MDSFSSGSHRSPSPDKVTTAATAVADDSSPKRDERVETSEKDESSSNGHPMRSTIRSVMIVVACTGTQILNVSGLTSVSAAMPVMAKDLNMSNDAIPWIISAFALSSGCLLLLFGRLADLYGRKLIWQIGVMWTIAMTIACALSRTSIQLIVFRALAGAGPAAMVPAALGILANSFPPSRARSTAFATFSGGSPVGAAFGIVLGGVITEYASWRGLYYFLIGLGVVVWAVGVLAIERDPPTDLQKKVDWIGAFLVTAGLTLITFSVSNAPTVGWGSLITISLLIIGTFLVGSFVGWEYYLIHHSSFPPLMSLDIWTRDHGRFAAMQAVGFMGWGCYTALRTYIMLYYQNYLGLSPLYAMCRFLPNPVAGLVSNVAVALLVGRMSAAVLLILGLSCTSASALIFALIDPKATYWQYSLPAQVMSVSGADFSFACGTLFIAKIAQSHEQSVAAALFQTITTLGVSVGLAIATVAQVVGMNSEAKKLGVTVSADALVKDIPPPVLLKGYRAAQYAAFSFGVFGIVIVVIFLRGIGVVGTKKKGINEETIEKASEGNENSEEKLSTV